MEIISIFTIIIALFSVLVSTVVAVILISSQKEISRLPDQRIYLAMGFSIGLSLGAGLGVFLGILSHNPAVFVTIGSITGISIGVTVSHSVIKPDRIDE